MECEHNWVRSGYGNDLICTKCGYAATQATIKKELGIQSPSEIWNNIVSKAIVDAKRELGW